MTSVLKPSGSQQVGEAKAIRNSRLGFFSYATWFPLLLLVLAVGGAAQQDRKIIKKVNPEYPLIAKKLNLQVGLAIKKSAPAWLSAWLHIYFRSGDLSRLLS
jgi:hypothetical protein